MISLVAYDCFYPVTIESFIDLSSSKDGAQVMNPQTVYAGLLTAVLNERLNRLKGFPRTETLDP
jgi:hypothetical protein